jgi:hypothetical protein
MLRPYASYGIAKPCTPCAAKDGAGMRGHREVVGIVSDAEDPMVIAAAFTAVGGEGARAIRAHNAGYIPLLLRSKRTEQDC